MRSVASLLFALVAFAATGTASPASPGQHDERHDRRGDRVARESPFARIERIRNEIERKRARIEREHARGVAEAERRHARERDAKGDDAWLDLLRKRGELAARRDDALLALEREQYARADGEYEEDD